MHLARPCSAQVVHSAVGNSIPEPRLEVAGRVVHRAGRHRDLRDQWFFPLKKIVPQAVLAPVVPKLVGSRATAQIESLGCNRPNQIPVAVDRLAVDCLVVGRAGESAAPALRAACSVVVDWATVDWVTGDWATVDQVAGTQGRAGQAAEVGQAAAADWAAADRAEGCRKEEQDWELHHQTAEETMAAPQVAENKRYPQAVPSWESRDHSDSGSRILAVVGQHTRFEPRTPTGLDHPVELRRLNYRRSCRARLASQLGPKPTIAGPGSLTCRLERRTTSVQQRFDRRDSILGF